MRYYEIIITDPFNPKWGPFIYTSFPNKKNDPNALNIEFNCQIVPYATSVQAVQLIIYGIDIKTISNAFDFARKNISISAGFQKGLPLASPAQSGKILQGQIIQSYGNWIGTEMSINFIIVAGSAKAIDPAPSAGAAVPSGGAVSPAISVGDYDAPINGHFTWVAGTQLSTAIANFLSTAFPTFPAPDIKISPNLVIGYDQNATYGTLRAFADWVKPYSYGVIGGNYNGVDIILKPGNQIAVYDGTVKEGVKTTNIEFYDLIGQPIWLATNTIQFKCPMRADIDLGQTVVLPKKYFSAIAPQDNQTSFNYRGTSQQNGSFTVAQVNHFGNFRQPTADSWVTVIECFYTQNVSTPLSTPNIQTLGPS